MGTLAESFLADLEDLSDASVSDREEEKNEEDDVEVRRLLYPSSWPVQQHIHALWIKQHPAIPQMANEDDVETLNYDNLEAVAHLQGSERYNSIMQVSPLRMRLLMHRTQPCPLEFAARNGGGVLGAHLLGTRAGTQGRPSVRVLEAF